MMPTDEVKNTQELAALVQKKWQNLVNMGGVLIFILVKDEEGKKLSREEVLASLERLVPGKEFTVSIEVNVFRVKINNGGKPF